MRRSWKKRILSLLIVLALAFGVWYWNGQRKVDIKFRTQLEISQIERAKTLHLSFMDEDEKNLSQATLPLKESYGVVYHHVKIKPGKYLIKAIVEFDDNNNLYLEKNIEIPNQDAEIFLFLRKDNRETHASTPH